MKKILLILIFILSALNLYAQTYPPKYTNHNKIKDCKNLLQKYTLDELSMMISTGNFDDIYVGDYIEMEMTSDYGTEKVRWLVAGIDYFLHRSNTEITDHHIVLVAEDCFKTQHRMNSTNTTAGGFAGSEMFTTTLPKYNTAITNAFGSSHIITYNNLLSSSMSSTIPSMAGNNYTGASNGWAWTSTTLCLMSEPQLFGTLSLSSSYYDIGINNSQFPLFAQMPEKIRCEYGFNGSINAIHRFLLSGVASATTFCHCSSDGNAAYTSATASYGLRPYFLFK